MKVLSLLRSFVPTSVKIAEGVFLARQVKLEDAVSLNKIANEKAVNEFLNLVPPVPLSLTKKRIRDSLKDKNQKWLVAECEGKLVGSIVLRRGSNRSSHTADFGIAFSTKARGKGFARLLLEISFDYLKKNKVGLLYAQVVEDNLRARRFYEKLGFKECGCIPLFFKHERRLLGMVLVAKNISALKRE